VNADWNAATGIAQILNKPSLATVATSGSASDLSTGTLADARLSSNVPLINAGNSFTAGQTITAAANTSALTASYSVTGANTTPLLSLTGTWNTSGVVTGLKLNITNTASGAGSLLADFQVGSASKFNINANGEASVAFVAGSTVAPFTSGSGSSGFKIVYLTSNAAFGNFNVQRPDSTWLFGANNTTCAFNGSISLGTAGVSTQDCILIRDAANTLAQRNGTNAQTARLYGTYTDASNGRWLSISNTTGGLVTLTATGNGTGASGNLLKLTAPILLPSSSVSLATNGDLAFEATSNTVLTIRYRGSDGTTRSATIALI
jgi:hypothetical protein